MANERKNTEMSDIRQRMHESVDKTMDKAESMEESGADALNRMKDRAILMKENADGYIKKNPEKSVLIAAGVGAVVGALLVSALARRRQ